jgi:hypothetical protein
VPNSLGYVFDAIHLCRHSLAGTVPLIGFCGAPWTLMCYMVEGGGAKSYTHARKWLFAHPAESHQLLALITDVLVEYLILQVAAGAQLLEVFDTWSGELTAECFKEFILPYIKQLAQRVKEGLKKQGLDVVPMTLFPKGQHRHAMRLRLILRALCTVLTRTFACLVSLLPALQAPTTVCPGSPMRPSSMSSLSTGVPQHPTRARPSRTPRSHCKETSTQLCSMRNRSKSEQRRDRCSMHSDRVAIISPISATACCPIIRSSHFESSSMKCTRIRRRSTRNRVNLDCTRRHESSHRVELFAISRLCLIAALARSNLRHARDLEWMHRNFPHHSLSFIHPRACSRARYLCQR